MNLAPIIIGRSYRGECYRPCAYEVKWNAAKANKVMSKTFLSAYPQVECHGVSPQNYIPLLMKEGEK
jgi:hypothetical protein